VDMLSKFEHFILCSDSTDRCCLHVLRRMWKDVCLIIFFSNYKQEFSILEYRKNT